MSIKKVTVIIPCYNVENYIDRCLNSVVKQTIGLDAMEIICVDDDSTDGTFFKLKQWKSEYPDHILVIKNKNNEKQGASRNKAFALAKGEYIGYVDSDDWIEPDMYERMYEKAKAYQCDIVHCEYKRDSGFDGNEDSLAKAETNNQDKILYIENEIERKKFIVSACIGYYCMNKLINAEFLRENNIYFPEKLAYEDLFWGSLIYLYATRIYFINQVFYHYFTNPASTVLQKNVSYQFDILQIMRLRIEEYKKRNVWDKFQSEIEFELLVSGYLSAVKIFFTRFTKVPFEKFYELQVMMRDCFPNASKNPYITENLTQMQQLTISLIQSHLSVEELKDLKKILNLKLE